ncbi:hypothetical protein [Caminibacter pacificus]|uniref:Uncharacterized protein n=1 Tax=Caminibacter pacificus TaxID=1424653 RepID=A0AAJ4RB43_9BACT|nr:hypothetical protein [Caminibacter pacificus]QDD68206.1 hypothetical protein C6V80_10145 [Caminibacter pacificus]ROR38718.1 hypothetical protein EDC58_1933 [Caminibacter pacificus]
MACPKNYLITTIAFLEKMVEKGYLPNDPETKKRIAIEIAKDYENYLEEFEKYQRKNNSNKETGIDLISKSLLYSVNFNEEAKPEQIVLSTKSSILNKYDIQINVKSLFKEDETENIIIPDFNYTFYTGEDKIVLPKHKALNYFISYFAITDPYVITTLKDFLNEQGKIYKEEIVTIDDNVETFIEINPQSLLSFLQNNNVIDEDKIDVFELNKEITAFYLADLERALKSNRRNENLSILSDALTSNHIFSESKFPLKIRLIPLDEKIVLPEINYKSKGEEVKEKYIVSFDKITPNKELPHLEDVKSIQPQKVTFSVHLTKKLFQLEADEFNDEVSPLILNNTAMNKKYFYPETILNEFKNVIVDESDKNLSGLLANIFRKIGQGDGKNIVIATGSPIAGYGKDLVYLMGYSGELTIDMIQENVANFNKLVGVYEINLNQLKKILPYLSYKEVDDIFENAYQHFVSSKAKDKVFNSFKFFNEIATEILRALTNLGESNKVEMDTRKIFSIDKEEFAKDLDKVFSLIYKEKISDNSFQNKFFKLSSINNNGIFKLIPSILNPKTMTALVKMFPYSSSIMSRETLKGRKEIMNFLDLDNFQFTYQSPDSIKPEKAFEYNDMSVRFFYESARYYSAVNYINQIYFYTLTNFSSFIKMLKTQTKELKKVFDALGFEYSVNDIKTLLSKSSTSGKDTMYNLYKTFIDDNGSMENVEKLIPQDVKDDKMIVFNSILKIFDIYMNKLNEITKSGGFSINLGNDEVSFKVKETDYIEEFKNILGETLSTKNILFDEGYPYIDEHKVIFTYPLDLAIKREWKELLRQNEDGKYIPYNFRITNKAEEDLFDVLGSKGIYKNIEDVLKRDKEKGFVISSARTGGAVFNLLDTLTALIRAKQFNSFPMDKKVNIIFNVPSSEELNVKDILSRIREELIKPYNIEIIPVSRTSLDSQLRSSINKKYYTIVVSNYESVSRGLDLSALSHIIATGRMTKGKEFIQFLSRLFSVDNDKADIFMFHSGYDVTLAPKNKDSVAIFTEFFNNDILDNKENINELLIKLLEAEEIVFTNTSTNETMKKSYDKIMTYKFFMSGERTGAFKNEAQNSLFEAKTKKSKETTQEQELTSHISQEI